MLPRAAGSLAGDSGTVSAVLALRLALDPALNESGGVPYLTLPRSRLALASIAIRACRQAPLQREFYTTLLG